MSSQLNLFDLQPAVAPSPDLVILGEGPLGRTWIEQDAVISAESNPLYFRCALCGRVTSSADQGPDRRSHEPGCWHPYAQQAKN